MSWANERWTHLRRVFRLPSTRRRIRDELDDELRFHLEGRIEDLMASEQLSRAEAEREARRRFGDYQAYRQEARSIDDTMLERRNRMEMFDALRRESRHALRSLARTPTFSLIAIITLALGLGAATTIFTLLDRVVIRPLPYPNADRLIHIGTLWPKIKADAEYSLAKGQYFYFKKHSNVLADLLMYDEDIVVVPGDDAHAVERVHALEVSANTFGLLGIRPELGHVFPAELERSRDATVALISHGYWQRRFGGDPAVVGKRLQIGGDGTVEIIGVLPANAALPDAKGEIWIRNYLNPNDRPQNNHTHHAIGLLKPGVTIEAAAADIKGVQDRMMKEYPDTYSESFIKRVGFAMNTTWLHDAVVGSTISRALWLLFGAVGFVLLIAAANVANLFLVRIDARRREAAVRTALGAGRTHLAVHYLTESLLLTIAAGLGAVALGYTLLHTVVALAPQSLPRLDDVSFDWRSVAFCMITAATFGVVFGLLPLTSATVDVGMLRDGGRGLTTSRRRDLARRGLVLAQVALAVVLLSGAALMVKSFARLRDVRPGFDPAGVVSMTIALSSDRYSTYEQSAPFWRQLSQRVNTLPGVIHSGATDNLPLLSGFGCSGVITDAVGTPEERGNCMPMVNVTPGYFETMGITVKGTLPTWSSVEAATGPLVVSAAFAKRFWHDENPIGHGVKPYNPQMPSFPVVGVAEDLRGNGLQKPVVEAIYFPIVPPPNSLGKGMSSSRYMYFVIRAPNANATTLIAAVRQIVKEMDPQVPIADIQPMELVVAKSMAQTTFTMMLLLIAAIIALSLSAVGVYGVIAYVVSQRRAEIGIRIALGARLTEVARLIVGQSLTLAAAGAAVGVLASLASTRLLGAMLFEVSPTDPLILGGTALVLVLVALAASLGPTRQAAKIEPVEAMRT